MDGMKNVETKALDLYKLREDIGAVKGIGESRLNEIMTVIEKFSEKNRKKYILKKSDLKCIIGRKYSNTDRRSYE